MVCITLISCDFTKELFQHFIVELGLYDRKKGYGHRESKTMKG